MSTKKADYEPHPLAKMFPLHEGPPLWEMANNIKEHGQLEPIVLLDGMILDGRRRNLACFRAEVKPKFREFGSRKEDGKDPLEFVFKANYHRRHLGEADKKLAAAEYANHKNGRPAKPAQLAQVSGTNAEAAEKFDVTEADVRRGKAVLANGTPALVDAVRDETVTISDAAKVAQEPPKVQEAAVKAVREGKARTAAGAVKPKKKLKPGQPLYDPVPITEALSKLTRLFDSFSNAVGKCREHSECIDAMGKVLTAWNRWLLKIK